MGTGTMKVASWQYLGGIFQEKSEVVHHAFSFFDEA
jgi:hypothetical protein